MCTVLVLHVLSLFFFFFSKSIFDVGFYFIMAHRNFAAELSRMQISIDTLY